jgi:predicted transcriptional regulator of viral defense system
VPVADGRRVTRRIHRAAELRTAGHTAEEVHRMLRSGTLTAVRRGVYVEGEQPDDAAARHALLVRAAVAELDPSVVVSHVSAAVLHGLSVWGPPLDVVQVTRNRRRSGSRQGSCVHVHCAPLSNDEITLVDGIACTSVARTVVDVARTVAFEHAVVSADAALRGGLGRPALAEALRRVRGWPGAPAARRVAAFADAGSESVGESRSRVAIALAGLPAPVLQWPVRYGATTAYADFGWAAQRTVGEFDGKVKYGRLLRPGQEPGDVVFAEKLREDEIRAQDWEMVRWTWRDLRDFGPTAARIRERFRAE